jgi:O-antigen/teichoic acid export membrane protein
LSYKCLKVDKNLLSKNSYKNLKELATKYSVFLKFQTFADVINVVTQQMPNFLLSKFALNAADLGLYGQANRVIIAPSSIVTGSVADVFKQKANQDYQEKGNALAIFKKTRKLLFLIMIIPCLIVAIFGPSIFALLFGDEWRQSGVYGQIIMIMVFPKFIVSSLSYMYIIARKQREDFYLHIYILITTLLSFFIAYKIYGTTEAMLLLFSINYAIIYIIYYFRSYKFAKGKID